MNKRIDQLIKQSYVTAQSPSGESHTYFSQEKFAELIVRMCADAADMYEGKSDCVGDCVAEYMGYGAEEGVTEWRAK
jgi:hypothetical protein